MSRWYASRERRRRARLLVALAIAATWLATTQIGVGGQAELTTACPALSPNLPAMPVSQPPLLMYDVRRALEQMERQV